MPLYTAPETALIDHLATALRDHLAGALIDHLAGGLRGRFYDAFGRHDILFH
jgi:hypothetical protein